MDIAGETVGVLLLRDLYRVGRVGVSQYPAGLHQKIASPAAGMLLGMMACRQALRLGNAGLTRL